MKQLGSLYVTMFQNCVVRRCAAEQVHIISDQDNDSKKVWLLLAYLLWNRSQPVSRDALFDLLWEDEEISDPANALKALIFRVRNLLGKSGLGFENTKHILRYQGGGYTWHGDLDIMLDAEQFEAYCAAADAAQDQPDVALLHLRAAISLYRGGFLSQSITSNWITPLNTYFHAKFLKTCTSAIVLLQRAEQHEEIIALCRSAIAIEPYDELLHRAMIRALAAVGAVHSAIQHYQQTAEIFMKQLSVSLSEETIELYHSLHKSAAEYNVQAVRNELEESSLRRGPYFCSYATFKDIYQLSARSAVRSGQVMQLVMLTLQPRGTIEENQLHTAMLVLHQVIASTLRLGDVAAQYSQSQYLLLLPSANAENAEKVAFRLIQRFSLLHKFSCPVHHNLIPMLPLASSRALPAHKKQPSKIGAVHEK